MLHQMIIEVLDFLGGLSHHLRIANQVTLTSLTPKVTLLVEGGHVTARLLQLILYFGDKFFLILNLVKLGIDEMQVFLHTLQGFDILIGFVKEVVRHIEIVGICHRLVETVEDGTGLDRCREQSRHILIALNLVINHF